MNKNIRIQLFDGGFILFILFQTYFGVEFDYLLTELTCMWTRNQLALSWLEGLWQREPLSWLSSILGIWVGSGSPLSWKHSQDPLARSYSQIAKGFINMSVYQNCPGNAEQAPMIILKIAQFSNSVRTMNQWKCFSPCNFLPLKFNTSSKKSTNKYPQIHLTSGEKGSYRLSFSGSLIPCA